MYTEACDVKLSSQRTLISGVPADFPAEATGQAVDSKIGTIHYGLRLAVLTNKLKILADMRSSGKDAGAGNQVWNHVIWRYQCEYQQTDEAKLKQPKIVNKIYSNTDTPFPPGESSNREDVYAYILEYDNNGDVIVDSSNNNWISSSGYPLERMLTDFRVNPIGNHVSISLSDISDLVNK